MRYSVWLFVFLVVALPTGLFGMVKWYENRYTKLPVLGPKGHTLIDFHLQNSEGQTISLREFKGKINVVNYFFTHCSSVCPRMNANLKRLQIQFAGDPDLLIHSFTVDPERDSAAQLKKYSTLLSTKRNWQFYTGDKKEIYRLARKSFFIVANDGDGGPEDFIHSELFVLVDKQLRIRGYYNGTNSEEVQELVRDIKRLEAE